MLSEAATEFDLGPLSWVQGEIDEALTRGTEALAAFRSNPGDSASLKHARSHIHQAAGAIQMVGLDAVVAFTDEIERQLSRAEELPAADVAGVCDLVNHACRRLRVFLDDIANGAPPVPLGLYPEYEAMQKARGHDTPAPTDLFYPDLNVRAPRSAPSEIMPATRLASHLLKERRQYQRGLLEWLRGVDSGAGVMRDAISAIEDATSQANLRAFWWTAGALLEALEKGGLERSFGAKQLVARIDLQIRRVTEGSSKVADRLRREVLYFVAISKPAAPQIDAVQRAYSLATLIPSAEALDADVVRLQPLLREAREQLANAKDAWLKAASGRADSLPKLAQMLASANAKAAEIGHPALSRLAAALVERLPEVPAEGVSEPLAMEFATALLLAESAFENFNNLSPDFPGQVDAMLERLDAVRSGRSAPVAAPALDEMSRRAQERVLLSQVMREVKANLRHMEQVLDAFFRDHTRRFELAALAKDSQQIRGALRILDLDAAERLLALCQSQIEAYAAPETPVDEEGLELLAESLSGLGFYIDAVLHQRPDRDRMLAPLIAKRLGESPQPAAAEPQSVEDSVAELRAALPRLLSDVRNAPADAAARGELRGKLASLRDDADLIGDSDLVAQANAALADVDGGGDAALAASVDMIVESGVTPVPAISEETQRLLATDASGLDAELLDIYLAEADEVLDTVAEHRRVLDHTPGDREALVTVRRQFHTLKGSGRMVGLTELGELAWDVERMHNRLLEEDRRVTPAVLALIDVAQTSFRQWVRELRDTGRIATDAAPLQAALRAVEVELPGGMSAAVPPPRSKPIPVTGDSQIGPIVQTASAASTMVPPPAGAGGASHDADAGLVRAAGHSTPSVETAAPANPMPGAFGALDDEGDDSELLWIDAGSHAQNDAGEASAPTAGSIPDLELVDFPELGAPTARDGAPTVTILEESIGETIDVGVPPDLRDPSKPLLRVVADNTSALTGATDARLRGGAAHVSHVPGLTLLTDAPRGGESASQPESDDVTVGPVTLSRSLWRILCDEAEQNVAVLQHEVSVLQFDPEHLPIAAMVRASHTLCGIHRTGGIALIATTARALEQALLALEERGAPFPSSAQPVLARTAAGLSHFVGRVKRREGFTATDEREAAEISAELEEMRHEALVSRPPAEPQVPAVPAANARADATPAPTIDAQHSAESAVDTPAVADVRSPVAPDDDAAQIGHVPQPVLLAPPPAASVLASPDAADALAPAVESTVFADVTSADEQGLLAQAWQPAATFAPPAPEPRVSDESLLDVADDLDETILPIFLEEAAELLPQAGEQVRVWQRSSDDAAAAHLRRTLHTLKGSARMAGAMRLGELAHRMESRLSIGDAPVAATPDLFEALETDLDRLSFVLDALRDGKANVALPWLSAAQAPVAPPPDATAKSDVTQDAHARSAGPIPAAATSTPAISQESSPAPAALRSVEQPEVDSGARAMLRVRADIVDQLVNEAGEVAIARARVEGELRALKANLLELTTSVIRLRGQVREIELQAETQIQSRMSAVSTAHEGFDPLELDRYTRFQELTRSFAEGVNDVSTVQQALLKNLDDADAALLSQARLSRDVQQRLFSIRTVPFNSLSERLYRILRKTARELGKRANLEIQGAQTELDRSVLEKLAGPLEHLLRNALDHGIETRAARIEAGKSETGEIALTVRQVGNEIVIELVDDGAGIDFTRVRERAVGAGLVAPDSEPTEPQLVECLFQPGFSTASKVTQISGRGIGMDVVRNEITALGGRVDVHSSPGAGTRFNLFLPLTLAVAQAVLVRAGGRMWALPAPMVEQVQQIKPDVLRSLYSDRQVHWQGRAWPFHYLPRLLGDAASVPEIARYNAVLLIRSGQGITAIHVDEMVGNQEVVVKNIGPQLARVPGISGATVLGTGEIVLIINPVQLAQRPGVLRYDPSEDEELAEIRRKAASTAPARKLVMVVDDSLTVRKFTTRLLTREGFEVVTARDGVDALKVLSEHAPDVILLDIEMPRMDGFEFAKTIKGDAKTAQIPIVMITSRTADKHRNRASDLGVDRFLGKPYQEDELLRSVRDLVTVLPNGG